MKVSQTANNYDLFSYLLAEKILCSAELSKKKVLLPWGLVYECLCKGEIIYLKYCDDTFKSQWLKYLWDHGNLF